MKNMQLKLILILVLFIASGLFSQDSATTAVQNNGDQPKKVSILIARQESEFKIAVAEKVKELYAGTDIIVVVVDIKLVKKQTIGLFNAVVIINEVRAWHLNIHTKSFLRMLNTEQKKKVIMISTAMGTNWKTRQKDVDAVTVASESSGVGELAGQIKAKIDALVNKQ